MKKLRRIILILLILVIGICIINSETDFFLNFGNYFPAMQEKFPGFTTGISDMSVKISEWTDYIPSPSEIIAMIKHEDPPIDPSDVAVNAYISDSPMLSFYPNENIGIMVDYDKLKVFGVVKSKNKSNLIVEFAAKDGESIEQIAVSADSDGKFTKTIDIPETNSIIMNVTIYTGSKPYGQFESWVYNYIRIVKNPDGGWELDKSPVFDNNKIMFEKDKSIKEALKETDSIQSKNEGIISIANQLTEGIDNDYDKVLAIHDWVCSYVYYDTDSLNSAETPPYYAVDVVNNKKAVCLGFATLTASLCRSIGIPCNVVSGYALGIEEGTSWDNISPETDTQNHAWNEVYVDGRWMIVDTTWDCVNKIKNGKKEKGTEVSHLYFDANLQFFSNNHKIIEYAKKR